MKSLIVILTICALGYVIDHWRELAGKRGAVIEDPHGLIIYGSKAEPACVRLETQLRREGIYFRERDLSVEANAHELTDKFLRVGKLKGSFSIPVAEVDGVLYEGATMEMIGKRLR